MESSRIGIILVYSGHRLKEGFLFSKGLEKWAPIFLKIEIFAIKVVLIELFLNLMYPKPSELSSS